MAHSKLRWSTYDKLFYILVADAISSVDDVTNTVGLYVETLGNYWYMILDSHSNKRKFLHLLNLKVLVQVFIPRSQQMAADSLS